MIDIPDFIYPKDAQGQPVCPRCRKPIAQCDCPVIEPRKPKATKIRPQILLDKSGRQGKIVTLLKNLPADAAGLKQLAKTLKAKTGSGGTFYVQDGQGIIEIQGNHKKALEQYFI